MSEAWSGVKWADLMAAQGAIGTDFYYINIMYIILKKYSRKIRKA